MYTMKECSSVTARGKLDSAECTKNAMHTIPDYVAGMPPQNTPSYECFHLAPDFSPEYAHDHLHSLCNTSNAITKHSTGMSGNVLSALNTTKDISSKKEMPDLSIGASNQSADAQRFVVMLLISYTHPHLTKCIDISPARTYCDVQEMMMQIHLQRYNAVVIRKTCQKQFTLVSEQACTRSMCLIGRPMHS